MRGIDITNTLEMVYDFMEAAGQDVSSDFTPDRLALRVSLMFEEVEEASEAALAMATTLARGGTPSTEAKAHLLKELCDVQYVLDGFFATFGFDKDAAFTRVHHSNLSKMEGMVKRGDGKVMKGEHYKPPYLEDLVI